MITNYWKTVSLILWLQTIERQQGQVKPSHICSECFLVFMFLPTWSSRSGNTHAELNRRGEGQDASSHGTWMQSAVRGQQIAGVSQAALSVPLAGRAPMCASVFLQQYRGISLSNVCQKAIWRTPGIFFKSSYAKNLLIYLNTKV